MSNAIGVEAEGAVKNGGSAIKAIASGTLRLGSKEFDCYVLEDGKRVISQRGMIRVFAEKNGAPQIAEANQKTPRFSSLVSKNTDKNGAPQFRGVGNDFPRFLERVPGFTRESLPTPITFRLPTGRPGIGYEGAYLVEICSAYMTAFAAGEVKTPGQERLARIAMGLLPAFAKIGIIALIDEATQYQKIREDDYLGQRLQFYLRHEADKWRPTFSDSFVSAICKLHRWDYTGGRHPQQMSRVYHTIYTIVFGKDIADELKTRNPSPCFGSNHHQHLTEPARELLASDIRMIELLANQSRTSDEWRKRMRSHYRKEPFQLEWRS